MRPARWRLPGGCGAVVAVVAAAAALVGADLVPLRGRPRQRGGTWPPDGSYHFVPIGIDWDGGDRRQSRVKMCRLNFAAYHATPAVTPMVEDLIAQAGCRKIPANPANTYLTTLAELEAEYVARGCAAVTEAGGLDPSCGPSGVIFHESRCGSTLMSNMIAALPSSLVYSEVGPPNAVIRDTGIPFVERVHWLRVVFAAMARPVALHAWAHTHPKWRMPAGPETALPGAADFAPRHVFFKTQHTTSLYMDVFQAAFPRMPWIYLHRDPVEVMMSLLRDTPFAPLPDAPATEHLTKAHMDNLDGVPCMRSQKDRPAFLALLHNFTDRALAARQVPTEDWCAADLAWVIGGAVRAAIRARREVLARALAVARWTHSTGSAAAGRKLLAAPPQGGDGDKTAAGLFRKQRAPAPDPAGAPAPAAPGGKPGAAVPAAGLGAVQRKPGAPAASRPPPSMLGAHPPGEERKDAAPDKPASPALSMGIKVPSTPPDIVPSTPPDIVHDPAGGADDRGPEEEDADPAADPPAPDAAVDGAPPASTPGKAEGRATPPSGVDAAEDEFARWAGIDVTDGQAFGAALAALVPQCVVVRDGMVLDGAAQSGTLLGVGTGIFVEYPSLPLVVPLLLDSHLRPLSAATRAAAGDPCMAALARAAEAGLYRPPSPMAVTDEGVPPGNFTSSAYPFAATHASNLFALTLPSTTPPPPLPGLQVVAAYQDREAQDLVLTPALEALMLAASEFYSKSRATVEQLARLVDAPGGIRPFQRNGDGRLRAARAWTSIDVQGHYISDNAAKQTMAWAALRAAAAKYLRGLHASMVRFNVPFTAAEEADMKRAGVGELVPDAPATAAAGKKPRPSLAAPSPSAAPTPSPAPAPLDVSPSLRRHLHLPPFDAAALPAGLVNLPELTPVAGAAGGGGVDATAPDADAPGADAKVGVVYPQLYPLSDLLLEWNLDVVTPPGSAISGKYNSLRFFDFGLEREQAEAFRRLEVPFVVTNVTALERTVKLWEDDALLREMMGTATYTVDSSSSPRFLFYNKAGAAAAQAADPQWKPPTRTAQVTFAEWFKQAEWVSNEIAPVEGGQLPTWWGDSEAQWRNDNADKQARVPSEAFQDAKRVEELQAARAAIAAARQGVVQSIAAALDRELTADSAEQEAASTGKSAVPAVDARPATGAGAMARPDDATVAGNSDNTRPVPAGEQAQSPFGTRLSPSGKRKGAGLRSKAAPDAPRGDPRNGRAGGRKLLQLRGAAGATRDGTAVLLSKPAAAPEESPRDEYASQQPTDPAPGEEGAEAAFVEDSEAPEGGPGQPQAAVRNPNPPHAVHPAWLAFDAAVSTAFISRTLGRPAPWFEDGSQVALNLSSTPTPPGLLPLLQFDAEVADAYGLPSHKPPVQRTSRGDVIWQYLHVGSNAAPVTGRDAEVQRAALAASITAAERRTTPSRTLAEQGPAKVKPPPGKAAAGGKTGMASRELPVASPGVWMREFVPFLFPDGAPESAFFVVNAAQALPTGVHCRFGMPGIVAEAHWDSGRNFIAVGRGYKRVILLPPDQCGYLNLRQQGPSARHTAYDWADHATIVSKLSHARAVQVILQPGDVLYVPALWTHALVSLTTSIQCNARGGTPPVGLDAIERCGFQRPPEVEGEGEFTAPHHVASRSAWATTRLLPPLEMARLRVPVAGEAPAAAPKAALARYNTTPIDVLMPAHKRLTAEHIVGLLDEFETLGEDHFFPPGVGKPKQTEVEDRSGKSRPSKPPVASVKPRKASPAAASPSASATGTASPTAAVTPSQSAKPSVKAGKPGKPAVAPVDAARPPAVDDAPTVGGSSVQEPPRAGPAAPAPAGALGRPPRDGDDGDGEGSGGGMLVRGKAPPTPPATPPGTPPPTPPPANVVEPSPLPARTEVTGAGGLIDPAALVDKDKEFVYGDGGGKTNNVDDDSGAFGGSVGVKVTRVPAASPSATCTPTPSTTATARPRSEDGGSESVDGPHSPPRAHPPSTSAGHKHTASILGGLPIWPLTAVGVLAFAALVALRRYSAHRRGAAAHGGPTAGSGKTPLGGMLGWLRPGGGANGVATSQHRPPHAHGDEDAVATGGVRGLAAAVAQARRHGSAAPPASAGSGWNEWDDGDDDGNGSGGHAGAVELARTAPLPSLGSPPRGVNGRATASGMVAGAHGSPSPPARGVRGGSPGATGGTRGTDGWGWETGTESETERGGGAPQAAARPAMARMATVGKVSPDASTGGGGRGASPARIPARSPPLAPAPAPVAAVGGGAFGGGWDDGWGEDDDV